MSIDAYRYATLPGKPGADLVFTFHGTGGSETQLIGLATDLLPGATVVSPAGDVSEGGALRFFRRTGEGVYDMDDLARATEKMIGFVAAHKEAARAGRVVGLGYSNGANILAATVFARPDLFDHTVLMHPLIPFRPVIEGGLRGKRLLITAGQRDPICPPQLTIRLDETLRQAGGDVFIAWHPGGHEVRPEEIEAARTFLAAPVAA